MKTKLTKQGVRDLDSIGPIIKKHRPVYVEKSTGCKHINTIKLYSGTNVCEDCGQCL